MMTMRRAFAAQRGEHTHIQVALWLAFWVLQPGAACLPASHPPSVRSSCLRRTLPAFADAQLELLQSCTAAAEGRRPAAAAAAVAAAPATEQAGVEADAAAVVGAAAAAAAEAPACPWMLGFNRSNSSPLYYSLHRGLHARK